ncbi:hypothetical protein HOLleu_04086 [Holothuria leucospilota]|uniref:Uncharacterized protein n=1 Tax=Holothuria leucospilota TaxID=206669 RepID=A0A9Q1CTT6_HOLLE|nr:hypothetical protein HOLleu_04086 [Holothuria leucospilota]
MDVHILIWDNDLVTSLYYGSSGMEHDRAEDMLTYLKEMFDLNLGSLSTVNGWTQCKPEIFQLPEQEIAIKEYNVSTRMMNLGSCGLHILHNAFKSGAVASGWNVGSLLSRLNHLLHDAPTSRKDFKD